MNKQILRAINSPILVFAFMILVSTLTSMRHYRAMEWFEPDFGLLLILWMGLRRPMIEGGIMTLIFGYISELNSGAPQGLLLLTGMLTFLSIRFFAKIMILDRLQWVALLAMGITLLYKLLITTLSYVIFDNFNHWIQFALSVSPQTILNTLVALPFFSMLEKFDRLTHWQPERERDLEGDFYFDPGEIS